MTFAVLPNGTYGARQPSQRGFERLVTGFLLRRARRRGRPGGRNGGPVLALTTIGAKTGIERTSPVAFARDGDVFHIFAFAAGARNHPAWYFNIAAHPDRVVIVVEGEVIPVRARQLPSGEAADILARLLAGAPAVAKRTFARYRRRTDREFPVIRLERR